MKRFSKWTFVTLASALLTTPAWASSAIYATVNSAGLYGTGALFITFNGGQLNEPGCTPNATRIDIKASHPRIKEFFALALTAQSTGQRLYVNVNGCDPTTNNPTLDETFTSFIYLTD